METHKNNQLIGLIPEDSWELSTHRINIGTHMFNECCAINELDY